MEEIFGENRNIFIRNLNNKKSCCLLIFLISKFSFPLLCWDFLKKQNIYFVISSITWWCGMFTDKKKSEIKINVLINFLKNHLKLTY